MIELFEQNIKQNDRQSSKGNQLKWKNDDIWYKADHTGYEGLSEYVISHLLTKSSLEKKEFVLYNPIQIKYKNFIYNGASSVNFLEDEWQIITLERLFQNYYGRSLNSAIWNIKNPKERLEFIVKNVERITGLKKFGTYMNKILTIDAFFLNEDRHTHNLAVLMNEKQEFKYCPIFDNGAGLLSDTTIDYPLDIDIYTLISSVKSKTFLTTFQEQLDISEELYGANMQFTFSKKDVENLLNNDEALIYPVELRERIKTIIFEQMRKYSYLF